jgi:riboflavin kinase/FMN adenylyltransferase
MADGNMEKVRAMAGRYFCLHGNVVSERTRTGLGFPTANLNIKPGQALPPDGVYAGVAHVNGDTYPT